ncbi:phosphofructokinase [Flavobacterium album]|uniref:Phosphofructokinase n=1 Tax=Flavobacterium album TaxID=2175091 RepID=A0A2S1QTI8_9FLAO|nr:1-phosphofructokinase family hexose kinase [Flavobacterium album]AWH83686.1 phosphofructokinase [Flavobacterium album]
MIKHVLTITLNPTVDKSCEAEGIKPEKKVRCSQPKYEPGGGGINVSRGLARLGVSSTALFPSGGRTGELLEKLLEKEKVAIQPVPVSAETRENFIVVDTASNDQYRFGMPGEAIVEEEAEKIHAAILGVSPFPEIVVISGSLPPGIEPQFLSRLVKELKAKNVKVVADTSGDALTEILKEGVFLLKPNLGELSKLTGKEELDNESADEAAKQLIDEGKAEIVVVSMGPQGAYLVTKDENLHVPAPSVKKLSTVGAGDSMVAGMVSVLAKGGSMSEMAKMGVACGSAATMSKGTGLFTKENAERLYQWLSR